VAMVVIATMPFLVAFVVLGGAVLPMRWLAPFLHFALFIAVPIPLDRASHVAIVTALVATFRTVTCDGTLALVIAVPIPLHRASHVTIAIATALAATCAASFETALAATCAASFETALAATCTLGLDRALTSALFMTKRLMATRLMAPRLMVTRLMAP